MSMKKYDMTPCLAGMSTLLGVVMLGLDLMAVASGSLAAFVGASALFLVVVLIAISVPQDCKFGVGAGVAGLCLVFFGAPNT